MASRLRNHVVSSAQELFRKFGLEIKRTKKWNNPPSTLTHQAVFPRATYSPWRDDAEFIRVYEKVDRHTLVDIYRCYELWSLARQTADIPGDVLEVGVWRGGTGAILADAIRHMPSKKVYLADTFTGVVKAGERDTLYIGGEHSDTSEETVLELMRSLSITNTEILRGIFPDDTQNRVRGPIAMLHCDVDVYSSTKDIVEWCLPRIPVGGMLVFDDYGFSGCEGVTTYCDELRSRRGLRFVHNLNGHAVFVKVAD